MSEHDPVLGTLLEQDYQAKGVVKDQWGHWLTDNYIWDWYATLTFEQARQGSPDRMFGDRRDGLRRQGGRFVPGSANHDLVGWQRSQRSWDEWLVSISEQQQFSGGRRQPYWFRGREPNPNGRGTHFHALIGGVGDLSRRDAFQSWYSVNGIARILPYEPAKGAGWYVAKYVVKGLGDIQFSPNLGQHRKVRNEE